MGKTVIFLRRNSLRCNLSTDQMVAKEKELFERTGCTVVILDDREFSDEVYVIKS